MACSDVQRLQDIGRKAFDAASVIYPAVLISGLVQSAWLAGDSGCLAYMKLENEQVMQDACFCVTLLHTCYSWWAHRKIFVLAPHTAGDKILQGQRRDIQGTSLAPASYIHYGLRLMESWERDAFPVQVASLPVDNLHVVTCSSGNHALAVLHACQATQKR